MSITSETFNDTYSKSANLPHFFDNLGGNKYIPFLLLIITLVFTRGKENFGE